MGCVVENRKYLVSVKNRLIYLFTPRDSKEVLEDLNEYALESSEDLEEKYGTPKIFLSKLSEEALPEKKKLNLRVVGIALIILSFFVAGKLASGMFQALFHSLLLIAAYIALSGDDCLRGIIRVSRKEHAEYIKTQILMLFVAIMSQIFTAYIVPRYTYQYLNNDIKLFSTGEIVQGSSAFLIGVILLFVGFSLERYWRRQQVWMFGMVIQGIGMMISLYYYNAFVGNLTVKPIPPYILIPYFICLVFSTIWFFFFCAKEGRR